MVALFQNDGRREKLKYFKIQFQQLLVILLLVLKLLYKRQLPHVVQKLELIKKIQLIISEIKRFPLIVNIRSASILHYNFSNDDKVLDEQNFWQL